MGDYYSILGLKKNATDIEIKAAFRRLAKIYHPDKNQDPNAKQLFELILKAYDTLINPQSRKKYDYIEASTIEIKHKQEKFNYKTRGQKEWNVDVEELKRREFYKQAYQKAKNNSINNSTKKSNYSDYKNILFATPIAVGLLMMIVAMFNHEPQTSVIPTNTNSSIQSQTKIIESQLINGDKPYSGYFGEIRTYNTEYFLKIFNTSGYDAIIVVYDVISNQYLQHTYLKHAYTAEFCKLPNSGVYWKVMIGIGWNKDVLLLNNQISGAFDSIIQYQNWKNTPHLFNNNSRNKLTMLHIIDKQPKNKKNISSEIDFFKK